MADWKLQFCLFRTLPVSIEDFAEFSNNIAAHTCLASHTTGSQATRETGMGCRCPDRGFERTYLPEGTQKVTLRRAILETFIEQPFRFRPVP